MALARVVYFVHSAEKSSEFSRKIPAGRTYGALCLGQSVVRKTHLNKPPLLKPPNQLNLVKY